MYFLGLLKDRKVSEGPSLSHPSQAGGLREGSAWASPRRKISVSPLVLRGTGLAPRLSGALRRIPPMKITPFATSWTGYTRGDLASEMCGLL